MREEAGGNVTRRRGIFDRAIDLGLGLASIAAATGTCSAALGEGTVLMVAPAATPPCPPCTAHPSCTSLWDGTGQTGQTGQGTTGGRTGQTGPGRVRYCAILNPRRDGTLLLPASLLVQLTGSV